MDREYLALSVMIEQRAAKFRDDHPPITIPARYLNILLQFAGIGIAAAVGVCTENEEAGSQPMERVEKHATALVAQLLANNIDVDLYFGLAYYVHKHLSETHFAKKEGD